MQEIFLLFVFLIYHSKDILDLTVGCYDSLDQLIDVIVKKDDKA